MTSRRPVTVERRSRGPAETARLGESLGRSLGPGDVVALAGELGAGKTCFVRGLARGLGVPAEDPVVSPTFTLVQEYAGRVPLRHLDAYRLGDLRSFEDVAWDALSAGDGVVAVEWADRVRPGIPPGAIWVKLELTGPSTRLITFAFPPQHRAAQRVTAKSAARARAKVRTPGRPGRS